MLGRASELADLRAALAVRRLVTVTGAAGVGKSRLARAAAGPGAVVWVGESGEGRLAERVVRALGEARAGGPECRVLDEDSLDAAGRRAVVRSGGPVGHPQSRAADTPTAPRSARTPERSPAHATTRPDPVAALQALPTPHPLLVLDGVDPVHAECVGLVQRLLMAVPTLRVLVTARKALGLGEEHVLKLGALGLRGPAVELFLDRARTATGGELGSDDLAAAQRICRLLEGVPLAIELAASQLTRHSVTDLAARLERDQCWLTGPHPGPRRHRSLRDAVGAGYRLCERESRVVWARASVFTGSFTEATAVFVCSGAGVEPHQVPGLLAQLAASGVLETLGEPGGVRLSRYRMTRAARDFGAERLREAGESAVAYERHALHYRRVAAVAENLWTNGQQRQAVRLVREEYDDLTALVRHAPARPGHVEAALETVVDLWFWWAVHGHAAQGRAHLRRLLPLAEPGSPLLPRALWLTAWLGTADPETARELLGRAWTGAVLAGDDATVGRIAHVEGVLAWRDGSLGVAESCFAQAADLIPPGAPGGPAAPVSLAALAIVQSYRSPRAARRTAHRALCTPGADSWSTLLSRYALAVTDHPTHPARAWHRARRALSTIDTHIDAPQGTAALLRLIADVECGRVGDGGIRAFVPAGAEGVREAVDTSSPANR
ncbi:ATP-binding protein [Streptomyces acidiscabies]|uniref:ATP-binding protein n=1 Tax=Streptomyces acidiscabies TaxID=42234 RepID=UPI0038F6279F